MNERNSRPSIVPIGDRLFEPGDRAEAPEPVLVTLAAIAVYDRGQTAAPGERYEAQLAGYSVVRGQGASPWHAVRSLVARHRPLLERRWSGGMGL